MNHVDFFNQPLSIGDEVAFERPEYRELVLGKIVGFTPKFINVEWNNTLYPSLDRFRVAPANVVLSPKKAAAAMNDLVTLVPLEVRKDHPYIVSANEIILTQMNSPFTETEVEALKSDGWNVGKATATKDFRKIRKMSNDIFEVDSLMVGDEGENDYWEFDSQWPSLEDALLA